MAKLIPTRIGDALILQTESSFTIYAVGRVSIDGQQDFHAESVKHVADRAAAIAEAKAVVAPGRRIFLRNIDVGDWSEITN